MRKKILSMNEVQSIKKKITKLVFDTKDDFIINDYMRDKEKFIQSFTHYFNYSKSTMTKEVRDLIIYLIQQDDLRYIFSLT